ncbi:ABC transporter permease [uncultured Desulfobacter sp.]|uniref:ABC transporter permease n=1 Tax=uncultured Desulfobacter sp. TaxID=240139 RepID=UPI002AAB1116|nr:ABC transporter permease [uncultured Desulfobacter sp.]
MHDVLNPVEILRHLWGLRNLCMKLSRKAILVRYRGSLLGFLWAFVQPLMMLAVYTFVFSVIFEAKWGQDMDQGRLSFALALFVGILTFNIIGDTVNASPQLILGHANFVKKVVFPLEVLPLVKLIESIVFSSLGLVVLLAAQLIHDHRLSWTLIFLPIVWLPVGLFALGWSYVIASLGVFIRDIGSITGVAVSMLFFLSPIFYPLSAVPESLKIYCRLNPIAVFVQDARRVVLWGQMPDWPWLCGYFFISLATLVVGFAWFMKSKKAFADVL